MSDKLTPPRVKPVSLSGKTRLTYREAKALLAAALEGQADWDARAGEEYSNAMPESQYNALTRAIEKLKRALDKAGGYDADGRLYDPWEPR